MSYWVLPHLLYLVLSIPNPPSSVLLFIQPPSNPGKTSSLCERLWFFCEMLGHVIWRMGHSERKPVHEDPRPLIHNSISKTSRDRKKLPWTHFILFSRCDFCLILKLCVSTHFFCFVNYLCLVTKTCFVTNCVLTQFFFVTSSCISKFSNKKK